MKNYLDISGLKVGHLTVLSRNKTRDEKGRARIDWTCQCSCGNLTKKLTALLVSGSAKSCGCQNFKSGVHGNRRFDFRISLLRAKASNYKAMAKLRKIEWGISVEDACDLLAGKCVYCGSEPDSKYYHPSLPNSGFILINGIDRRDNDLGYINGNCVSCCTRCNSAKSDGTLDEFMAWIKRIANYQKS